MTEEQREIDGRWSDGKKRFEGYGDNREGNIRWSDDQTLVNQTDSVACDVSFTYGGGGGLGGPLSAIG